jgi:MFS family permease
VTQEPGQTQTETYNRFVLAHWKRNFAMHVVDGALYAMGMGLAQAQTVLPGFMRDTIGRVPHLVSYENRFVGIMALVMAACFMMPQQLWAARLAERRKRIFGILLLFAAGERLPWLFVGFMAAFLSPARPEISIYVFLALVFVYQFNIGLVYPVWQEMVAKTTPVRRRGLLFGVREGIGGITGFLTILLLRPLVARFDYPYNYALLFFGMFFFIAVSFAPLLYLKEAEYPEGRDHRAQSGHFLETFKTVAGDGRFVRYFICRSFFGMMAIAGPPFFTMRAMSVLGGDTGAGLALSLAAVVTLARTPCSLVAGPLGDRFGNRVVMSMAAVAGGLGVLCALFAKTTAGFYAAHVLGVFGYMSFWVGHGNYILELAPLEKRPSYIGLDNISGLPFVAMPFLGGWMADRFGYRPSFLLAVLFAAVAAVLFLTVAVEPRRTMREDIVA